MEHWGIIVEWC